MPPALFILGMHRSGTSAVAGTIELAGVPLGRSSDRMAPKAENPKGYWESTALALFNEELLETLGGSWSAPPSLPSGWTADPRITRLRDLGRALVATIHPASATAPWGWKDPRNSLVLPFWREILDVRPVIVLSHRNPLEVAESLASWRGLSKDLALALWERYQRSALENARGLPTLVVPYDGLMREPLYWRQTLEGFLGRHGFATAARGDESPRSLLESELRHSSLDPADVASDAAVTDEQRALFRLLEDLAGEHDGSSFVGLPPESPGVSRLFAERAAKGHASGNGGAHGSSPLEGVLETAELDLLEDPAAYRRRLDRERSRAEADQARLCAEVAARATRPCIAVVTSSGRATPDRARRALDSLRAQIADPRIDVVRDPDANVAFANVEADFVTFLDLDDAFSPEAFAEATLAFDANPDADLLYADEDRIDDAGERSAPFFKPSWSPDYLLSMPYLGRPLFLRRDLAKRLGGLTSDYDFMLRATELARSIVHVPKVLYHRGAGGGVDPDPADACRALSAALERRGEPATIEAAEVPGGYRVRRPIRGAPLVTIIIPFRDEAALVERCVRSIHELAGYDAWQAILVDNRSWQPETTAWLRRAAADPKCQVIREDAPFNWSAINNRAAAQANGELLLFLNDDVVALRPGWLAAMIEHAQRDEVGAVGARLLYPNGRVQHAGIMLHREAVARHPFRFLPADAPGYFGMARLVRNVTAVTGACMMVRRAVFGELGGFDERLAVAYSDVDFCLRLLDRRFSIVYTPYAELVHHEGLTRGIGDETTPTREMARRWAKRIVEESYVSPNLDWRAARLAAFEKESAT